MSRKAKIWSVALFALLVCLILAWFTPVWMSVSGTPRWIVTAALAVIGTFACVFTAVYLGKRPAPPPPPPDPLSQEVESSLALVTRRLRESGLAGRHPLQRMPVILVLGDREQQKTSTVVRSGTRAELMAGRDLDGIRVVPTQALNVWLARPALIAEPSVETLADPARRARMWHQLRPGRLSDAIRSGEQAPRAALVCLSVDVLRTAGRGASAGRELRQMLAEIAVHFGTRLPVYVAFTKLDAVPGFREYAKYLTPDEIQQVLGCTFPYAPDIAASAYGDFATTRAREGMAELVRSLATRRPLVLARGADTREAAAAFEFPREFAKLESEVVSFLVELVRPSELQLNPMARGFYFTGVRETIVPELAPLQAQVQEISEPADEGATALLGALPRPGAPAARSGGTAAGVRREPQWVFLDRLISGVLLNDPVAFAVTRAGARVSRMRRAVFAAGLAAALLVLTAASVSFARNRALAGRADRALQAVRAIPQEVVSNPDTTFLVALDSLGRVLDETSDHVHQGVPYSYGWGLSQRATLYPLVRAEYFRRFGTLLYGATVQRLVGALASLPPQALGDREYEAAYNRLKTYLIATQYHDSSTVAFMVPVLLADWPGKSAEDASNVRLARRQFERYAHELRYDRIYSDPADMEVVRRARAAINSSSGDLAIYQALIADANRKLPEFRFVDHQGAGMRTVSVPSTVPGAYTAKGWDAIHVALKNIDQYLYRENWVVGADAPKLSLSRDSLVSVLRSRYDADYAGHWRTLVRSANILGFSSLADAASRLQRLGSSSSELLVLLAIVNENIPPDSQRVAKWFTTVRKLGAPKDGPILTTEAMSPYLDAMSTLSTKVQIASSITDPALGKLEYTDALAATGNVIGQVQSMSRTLDHAEWDALGLQRLFEEPSRRASALLTRARNRSDEVADAASVEDQARAYCEKLSPIASKPPFATAGTSVTAEELADVLGPNSPLRALADALRRTTASAEATRFIGRLTRISTALYGDGVEPMIRFSLAPADEQTNDVSVQFGRQRHVWPPNQRELHEFTWNFASDRNVELRSGTGVANESLYEGPWAVLSFFRLASAWSGDGDAYRMRDADERTTFRVVMSPGTAALVRGDLLKGGLKCPTAWTR